MEKKKYALLLALGAVLILTGCQERKENASSINFNVVVPEIAYKECPAEYFEKSVKGKLKDCKKYPSEPVCVYYQLKADGRIHLIQQTNECYACRNWGQSDRTSESEEFLGMTKGKCEQGIYN